MKSLVIGLGMGSQYLTWFKEIGFDAYSLDTNPEKLANYTDLDTALIGKHYDIIYIGTPNYSHYAIAQRVADHADIVLIEKPGFKTALEWQNFASTYKNTRVLMVKNNQYRQEFDKFRKCLQDSNRVDVSWIRQNGIPASPWFCNRDQSYGGVSRDLMPHLLSYFTALSDFKNSQTIFYISKDHHSLGVDSESYLEIQQKKIIWRFHADWNNLYNNHTITFRSRSFCEHFDLGLLCPAEPYKAMITTAMKNKNNDEFWQEQLKQDLWIHIVMEKLCSSIV